jgi:hypothetical protein
MAWNLGTATPSWPCGRPHLVSFISRCTDVPFQAVSTKDTGASHAISANGLQHGGMSPMGGDHELLNQGEQCLLLAASAPVRFSFAQLHSVCISFWILITYHAFRSASATTLFCRPSNMSPSVPQIRGCIRICNLPVAVALESQTTFTECLRCCANVSVHIHCCITADFGHRWLAVGLVDSLLRFGRAFLDSCLAHVMATTQGIRYMGTQTAEFSFPIYMGLAREHLDGVFGIAYPGLGIPESLFFLPLPILFLLIPLHLTVGYVASLGGSDVSDFLG